MSMLEEGLMASKLVVLTFWLRLWMARWTLARFSGDGRER
jgi:hypothetical protein